MRDDRIQLSVEAGVAEVALARPDKMNALDPAMFEAINATIAHLAALPGLRAVVLHGQGRGFCAGLDMGSMAALGQGRLGGALADLTARTHGEANPFQQVAWGWRALPVPVVAALHGVVYGGGLQIALGADIRIVAPDAQLSVMEIRWGLVPDMAGCALLPRLVRGDALRELIYTGRIVDGHEAVALGLATRASATPLDEARTLARRIAAASPDAIRAGKRLAALAETATPAEVLRAEAGEQARLLGSPNQMEAVRAGLERRLPVFHDAGTPPDAV